MKSITIELPEWANWIAQDAFGIIRVFKYEPAIASNTIYICDGISREISIRPVINENWRDSKINLNTHGAYIDAKGMLLRCELAPDILKDQA